MTSLTKSYLKIIKEKNPYDKNINISVKFHLLLEVHSSIP